MGYFQALYQFLTILVLRGYLSRGGCSCSWSGSRSSQPNIIRLAVSPVTECGVPRKALIVCRSNKSHSSCSRVIGSSGNLLGCGFLSPPCHWIVGDRVLCGFYLPSTECIALPSVDSRTEFPGRCEAVRAVPDSKIFVGRGWLRLRGLWRLEWEWHLAIMRNGP